MLSFIRNISPKELIVLIVIATIVILFFGSRVITGLGKSSGETLKEIKKIKKNFTDAIKDDEPTKKGV